MKEKIEKLEIEVLTPIYIGGNDKYNLKKLDYIYDNTNKKIKIIDSKKLIEFILKYNKYNEFINEINKNTNQGLTIDKILQNIGLQLQDNDIYQEEIKINKIHVKTNKQGISTKTLNEIYRFIVDGKGDKYLPGSSMKGNIINAIKSNYIEKYKQEILIKQIDNEGVLKNNIKNIFEIKKIINNKERTVKIGENISIADAYLTDNNCTYIALKSDLTAKKNKEGKGIIKINELPIYREYIMPGTKIRIEMKINYNGLKEYEINSIEDIINCLNNKYLNIKNINKQITNKLSQIKIEYSYNKEEPNMILGAGVGYYHKSLISSIIKNHDNLKNYIKPKLEYKFKTHEHLKHDFIMSPRTIKLSQYENQNLVIGMCKIKVCEE